VLCNLESLADSIAVVVQSTTGFGGVIDGNETGHVTWGNLFRTASRMTGSSLLSTAWIVLLEWQGQLRSHLNCVKNSIDGKEEFALLITIVLAWDYKLLTIDITLAFHGESRRMTLLTSYHPFHRNRFLGTPCR